MDGHRVRWSMPISEVALGESITIYELPPPLFGVAAPLFAGAAFDAAFVAAVFEGRHPGRLFVDDPDRPTAGLLCRTFDYYLAGDPDGGGGACLRRFVREAPAEPEVFAALYGYVPLNAAWEAALVADHDGRLGVIPRRAFRFDAATGTDLVRGWRDAVPAGVRVVPIDRPLAERIDAELEEGIGRVWGGYDRFVAGGFGFCSLVDGAPASVAVALAVGAGEANIGVVTAEPFRRRGLATLTCSAYVERCLDSGLVPTWDSDAANAASLATARKLGFGDERPFSELGCPDRRPPPPAEGWWRAEPLSGRQGVTRWRRRERASAST